MFWLVCILVNLVTLLNKLNLKNCHPFRQMRPRNENKLDMNQFQRKFRMIKENYKW